MIPAKLSTSKDGSYKWQCEGCGQITASQPHPGRRAELCKRCQNYHQHYGLKVGQLRPYVVRLSKYEKCRRDWIGRSA